MNFQYLARLNVKGFVKRAAVLVIVVTTIWAFPNTFMVVDAAKLSAGVWGTELSEDTDVILARDRFATFPSSSALYDQEMVQRIYVDVSPAIVEIYTDQESGNSFTAIGAGSGFLIDNKGHIVTNDHVIQSADRVRVSFYDNTYAEAAVLGRDKSNDLALLKVDKQLVKNIKPLRLGDSSKVRPGQIAIIIGSPFGLKNSVSVGINAGTNRSLISMQGRLITGMLQTDALINPGNSGGPMLNSDAEVVGITTGIELISGTFKRRNLGFAVPVNSLEELLSVIDD